MGVDVKMVTGDHEAIAAETAGKLGLGRKIIVAADAFAEGRPDPDAARIVAADGFARVFPEHKFKIVKILQGAGHIVGMTGDGVNDAPALKQADIGIAVSGATDAARAAADLVLTAPGLSVITSAIEEARRIFERMTSYAVYRIAETMRLLLFMTASILIFNFYPVTAIMVVLLALLNDLPIMMIAYDNAPVAEAPVRWDMGRVLTIATALGVYGVIESFVLLLDRSRLSRARAAGRAGADFLEAARLRPHDDLPHPQHRAGVGAPLAELEARRSGRSDPGRRHPRRRLRLLHVADRLAARADGLGLRAGLVLRRERGQDRRLSDDRASPGRQARHLARVEGWLFNHFHHIWASKGAER